MVERWAVTTCYVTDKQGSCMRFPDSNTGIESLMIHGVQKKMYASKTNSSREN
jgi:hypothetical protein